MKPPKRLLTVLFVLATLFMYGSTENGSTQMSHFNLWFSILEIPFLVAVVILSFVVASSLKGGKFGKGMTLIAWGFLIMAIGHIHMQTEHLTGYNFFKNILGNTMGTTAWFAALLATWTLSGAGFYKLFQASRF